MKPDPPDAPFRSTTTEGAEKSRSGLTQQDPLKRLGLDLERSAISPGRERQTYRTDLQRKGVGTRSTFIETEDPKRKNPQRTGRPKRARAREGREGSAIGTPRDTGGWNVVTGAV